VTRSLLLVCNNAAFLRSHRLEVAKRAAESGWSVHLATPSGPEADALRQQGFRWWEARFTRGKAGLAAELRAFADCRRSLRGAAPGVAEFATVRPVILGGVASRLAGVPSVFWVPGLGTAFMEPGSRGARWRHAAVAGYRAAFGGRPARVLCENATDLRDLEGAGAIPDGARALVLPGASVRLDRFLPTPERSGTPVVLYAGRLLRQKGVPELAQAAALLHARGVALRVRIAGAPDPANPSSLSQQDIAALDRLAPLEWLGQRDDVPRLLADASVVCLPSWREGMPQVLLEAGACARAVVATDVPGCRELITHGETGWLVPPRDAAALADALARLAGDPGLRHRLAHALRERVVREFEAGRVADRVVSVYEELARAAAVPR
jgi:glycosyltransferase involved in cell wall biosynthesis